MTDYRIFSKAYGRFGPECYPTQEAASNAAAAANTRNPLGQWFWVAPPVEPELPGRS